MPIYTLTLAFIFFTGFAAIAVVPDLPNGDLALLTMVRKTFPAWMLGVIGGAGALTAMVPSAILLLTASTLFAKNLYRPLLAPSMADDQVARLARAMVVVLSLVSLYFATHSSATLVSLLLLGYAGISQFVPASCSDCTGGAPRQAGVSTGMVAGVACTSLLILGQRDPFHGFNAGFVALCVNFGIAILVSAIAPASSTRLDVPAVVGGDAGTLGRVRRSPHSWLARGIEHPEPSGTTGGSHPCPCRRILRQANEDARVVGCGSRVACVEADVADQNLWIPAEKLSAVVVTGSTAMWPESVATRISFRRRANSGCARRRS